MNRRNFLCIACGIPVAPFLPMASYQCQHDFYEWPRTAFGEDLIRQCIKCGDKEKMKVQLQFGEPIRTDTFAFVWEEKFIGDWVADGNSNPAWVRQCLNISLP